MIVNGALLDTSFWIRLFKKDDPLHKNAQEYYEYFLDNKTIIFLSTIVISEYCVKGNISDLPIQHCQILPFNIEHSVKAADLFKEAKANNDVSNSQEKISRVLIKDDTKLFAQVEVINEITHYISADANSKKLFSHLKLTNKVNFEFLELNIKLSELMGIFDF